VGWAVVLTVSEVTVVVFIDVDVVVDRIMVVVLVGVVVGLGRRVVVDVMVLVNETSSYDVDMIDSKLTQFVYIQQQQQQHETNQLSVPHYYR